MSDSVALIDYGAGNLFSVRNALEHIGAKVEITADPEKLRKASRIVLPGVGSFAACMKGLRASPGLIEAMSEQVLEAGVPFLGICVGMQLLATKGYEHGESDGLGWIAGEVRKIEPSDSSIKLPHMGWNDVALVPHARGHCVIEEGEAYFLHSYQFIADDPGDVAALTDHGEGLVAALARGNILGVQFHPEKSQAYGLELLERFLRWRV